MRKQLLQELKLISEEEKKYQSGQGNIEKQLYAKDSISEIDRELLLERGRLVTVRPHSRFVEFPEHRHNYVEMMYVVQGNITHIIEGKELTLHKGDVLMLNQQVRHAIRRAEYEDIGINFIALPEFFEIPLSMLHEKNVLAEFIVGAFRQKDPVSHYLLFQLQEDPQVENLMENMIVSMLHRLEGGPIAEAAGFTDVADGDWYADAVNWAASEGIVAGYEDNTFRPNDPITCEQLAAMLMNYAAWKGEDVSARADLSSYNDAASVSSWAAETVQWAVAEGLISGMPGNLLEPQGSATRAQVAAILQRYLVK